MDQVPHPVEVDRGIDAVVLQQRDRDTRNGGRLDVREALLQHVDTTHADDGFDLARLDHRSDDGRPFRHQHRIAETLRLDREVLDGAEPALFAQQAEFVKGRRALVFDPQALGNQEQTPVVRNLRQRVAPRRVAHQNRGVVAVDRVEAGRGQHRAGMLGQLIQGQRRNGAHPRDVVLGNFLEPNAVLLVVGNIRLRLPIRLPRHLHW